MKKGLIILAILVLLALGGAWLARWHRNQTAHKALTLHGNVDIREVNLGFRVPGRIAEVLRDEGDPIRSGELLARLDDEPYQRELEEARAQVASLGARVALLKAGYRPEEIAQARASFGEREVTRLNAERVFKRQQELFANKTVSIQERDDAEAKFREAEARQKSAQEQLNLVEAGYRHEEIDQAKADLSRAEAAVASAALRLEDTKLKAPSDGVILTRAQEPGAVLQAGATVMTLSLSKPVWIRAYVEEPELGQVQPGRKVEILTDSRPGRPYSGQIGFVSPRAEFTPKNVETTELRTSLVYRLRVVVEDPDGELRQGMPVSLRLR
jgi:HlyD family secretion protein